jgi:hypothetical protein
VLRERCDAMGASSRSVRVFEEAEVGEVVVELEGMVMVRSPSWPWVLASGERGCANVRPDEVRARR